MNRDIKFRAWLPIDYLTLNNKKVNEMRMVYGDKIKFTCSEEYGDPIIAQDIKLTGSKKVCANMNFDYDKAILMQFTGLKDKNGKEIYEGDILRYVGYISIVVFWEGRFCLCNPKDINCYYDYNVYLNNLTRDSEIRDRLDYEVIGNIYENPELLEETQKNG